MRRHDEIVAVANEEGRGHAPYVLLLVLATLRSLGCWRAGLRCRCWRGTGYADVEVEGGEGEGEEDWEGMHGCRLPVRSNGLTCSLMAFWRVCVRMIPRGCKRGDLDLRVEWIGSCMGRRVCFFLSFCDSDAVDLGLYSA